MSRARILPHGSGATLLMTYCRPQTALPMLTGVSGPRQSSAKAVSVTAPGAPPSVVGNSPALRANDTEPAKAVLTCPLHARCTPIAYRYSRLFCTHREPLTQQAATPSVALTDDLPESYSRQEDKAAVRSSSGFCRPPVYRGAVGAPVAETSGSLSDLVTRLYRTARRQT